MALVKYVCETCQKVWETEEQATACEAAHKNAVEIVENRYRKKAEPEKYPNSIVVKMADNKMLIYYVGRAERQPNTPLVYKSAERPNPTGN